VHLEHVALLNELHIHLSLGLKVVLLRSPVRRCVLSVIPITEDCGRVTDGVRKQESGRGLLVAERADDVTGLASGQGLEVATQHDQREQYGRRLEEGVTCVSDTCRHMYIRHTRRTREALVH
jgi:hypothetical protein